MPVDDLLAAAAQRGELDRWVPLIAPRASQSLMCRRLAQTHLGLREPEPLPPLPNPLDALDTDEALLEWALAQRGRAPSPAIGRLGKSGALRALEQLTAHRDPNPRAVALRWLRKRAPREVYLRIAADRLILETHPPLRRTLVLALAHARHEPSFPRIIDAALESDDRIARPAKKAIEQLGEHIAPALQYAIAHARPDRRSVLEQLLDEAQ